MHRPEWCELVSGPLHEYMSPSPTGPHSWAAWPTPIAVGPVIEHGSERPASTRAAVQLEIGSAAARIELVMWDTPHRSHAASAGTPAGAALVDSKPNITAAASARTIAPALRGLHTTLMTNLQGAVVAGMRDRIRGQHWGRCDSTDHAGPRALAALDVERFAVPALGQPAQSLHSPMRLTMALQAIGQPWARTCRRRIPREPETHAPAGSLLVTSRSIELAPAGAVSCPVGAHLTSSARCGVTPDRG